MLGFLTLGFAFLFGFWYPVKRLKITHQFCGRMKATMLLIKQVGGGQYFVTKMMTSEIHSKSIGNKDFAIFENFLLSQRHFNYFEHMFLRYYFMNSLLRFTKYLVLIIYFALMIYKICRTV